MKLKRHIIMNIIIISFVLLVIIPTATIAVWTFTERWAWPDLTPQFFSMRAVNEILGGGSRLVPVVISSILISVCVAALSVAIGIMTARALIFYDFPGKEIFSFFAVLPFMVPATVFAMGIQIAFIKAGINNTVLGVVAAHLICSLPYAVRLLMDGTMAAGKSLEEQARVLGATAFQAFFKVMLPVLTPVILSAFSMSYIVSFSQYFLTLLIGGGQVKTFTIVMVPYLQSGNRNIACVYSTLFLGITLVIFGAFEWIAGRWNKNNKAEFYS